MDAILAILNESLSSKRGVTLVLSSSTVGLLVTEVTDTAVTGRSQEYDRIAVRIDRIQAAYM